MLFRDEESAADRSLILREAREEYEAMRGSYMRFIKHPERLAEMTDDPLADDPEVSFLYHKMLATVIC